MLIDTHCHLNDSEKFPNVGAEVAAAREAGVERMIVVGVEPKEWDSTLALTHRFPELACILGWHPNYTRDYSRGVLEKLGPLLKDPRCLGLGEIGLDYHWDYSPREVQREALEDQLDLAAELSKPVIFHAREAYGDLLSVLEGRARQPYLFHCFVGSQEDARRAIELDSYFGIDGPITYKKSEELREVVKGLPLDRIVLETDSPYLSPVPFRGKPNRPAYVPYINEVLASVLGITAEEAARRTSENAVRFFGWPNA